MPGRRSARPDRFRAVRGIPSRPAGGWPAAPLARQGRIATVKLFAACALAFSAMTSFLYLSISPPKTSSIPYSVTQARIAGSKACASPPASFNPLTASAAEIAYYGLPKKPTDQSSISAWAKSLDHAKTRVCDPVKHSSSYLSTPPPQVANPSLTFQKNVNNYTGYAAASGDYKAAQEYYNLHCTHSPGLETEWIGLDGITGDGYLWQAGWDTHEDSFFYEEVGGTYDTYGEVLIGFSPQPNCGDLSYTYADLLSYQSRRSQLAGRRRNLRALH
jgi:hypothetical protein